MKYGFSFLVAFMGVHFCAAQLTISSGATLSFNGNVKLTLSNMDLVNNGSLSAGNGSILFAGNADNNILGTQSVSFYDLTIGKTAGTVQLHVPLAASHHVSFTSGLLDLNGNDLNLGTTGSLSGEQETSHVIGSGGGSVIFTTDLSAPIAANPGNLGMIITSAQNLGNTTIKRGHQSQSVGGGTGNSITRYYDITAANNTNLDATVRFTYLDAELNGLDENSLVQWEKPAGQPWEAIGFDSRNTTSNYVEKNAVPTVGRFTLSTLTNPLPVQFISFTAHCTGNAVLLSWQTAQEENSHYFQVEKSSNGNGWISLAQVAAAGNASSTSAYSYSDVNPQGSSFYRIVEFDLDGRTTIIHTVHTDCSGEAVLAVWPNPVKDILYMNIPSNGNLQANIQLFDARGSRIKQEEVGLLSGMNAATMAVNDTAPGIYFLKVSFSNGHVQTIKIIKW